MILVVTYELKQPPSEYAPLFEALKSKNSWAHYMDSTWLIDTDQSPREFGQELFAHIYDSDRLLVTRLVEGYHGWLPSKAWDWIKRHRDERGEQPESPGPIGTINRFKK
jgi:hypothetical protein